MCMASYTATLTFVILETSPVALVVMKFNDECSLLDKLVVDLACLICKVVRHFFSAMLMIAILHNVVHIHIT